LSDLLARDVTRMRRGTLCARKGIQRTLIFRRLPANFRNASRVTIRVVINRFACLLSLCMLQVLCAAGPLPCPAGAPIGSFRMSVSQPGDSAALQLQSINELL